MNKKFSTVVDLVNNIVNNKPVIKTAFTLEELYGATECILVLF